MPPMFRPSTSTIVDTVSTWEPLEDITSRLIMQDRRCLLLLLTVEEERWMKSSTRTHYEPLSIISSLTQYHCSLQHIRSRIKDLTMSKHILPCALFNAVLNVLSLNNLGIIYYIHVTWVLWWLQQGTDGPCVSVTLFYLHCSSIKLFANTIMGALHSSGRVDCKSSRRLMMGSAVLRGILLLLLYTDK